MTVGNRDITPDIGYLRALQQMEWDAKGAISELVDNSFGEARGNAKSITIQWNPRTRELIVLDDGRGMRDVADLFQLGKTAGRSPRDIGIYGSGGTMACLWLASKVEVWTLRDKKVSSTSVVWSEFKAWHQLRVNEWQLATLNNTPSDLFGKRHGTLVKLHIPKKKKFLPDVIQRELAKRYSPALRQRKQIFWEAAGNKTGFQLVSPHRLTNAIDLEVALPGPRGEETLRARGKAGISGSITAADSKIEIGFGHRIIKRTSDCFTSPSGEISYGGTGVTGWLDLDEGWQEYLTTTKTDFNDDETKDALDAALFAQLEPLLKKVERDSEQFQLDELSYSLSMHLEGAFDVDVEVSRNGPSHDPDYEWSKVPSDDPEDVPAIEVTNDDDQDGQNGQQDQKQDGRCKIRLHFEDHTKLNGCICQSKIEGNQIHIYIDKDDAGVKEARERKNPTQNMLMSSLFIPSVSAAVLELPNHKQRQVMRRGVYQRLEEIESQSDRFTFLHGHLLRAMYARAIEG